MYKITIEGKSFLVKEQGKESSCVSCRTTTFPLDRQGKKRFYIYVVYIVIFFPRETENT